ncbi:hypothetical protein PI126_g8538 [Phytophthora idaei]|nr:hypothetical protein PI126_g8538 [Phytophthora idaei]
MIQPLLEEEDGEMDPLEQLEPVDTMMTVTVVEPVIRPRQHLIRRSSSAVERVPMPATPEELEDGGDKSLRPRFLQERSATIVHITPQVAEPARVPRSKASAFLLDVLAKSRGSAVVVDNRRSPLEPLHPPGVTNTVHYVPQHGGERGVPLRKAARKTRRIGRKLSIDTSSDLLASDKPERTRGRRVSASQEHMAAIVRALQDSKQQMQEQFQILHSILRFTNSSARDEDGKRPVLKEMVDVGIIPELASTMREFRFHTGLQICVMTILSALAEESPLNAYMMSEFNLETLLQKTVTVHATQDRVVMLASNLVRAIEDSKHTVNIPAYQAEKAAKASRQSATYTNTVVAAITRQTLSSPSPTSKSSRVLISSAPSPEKRGLGIEKTNLAQSAGRQRQAFSPDMVRPALSANYRLLVSQKLKKAEGESSAFSSTCSSDEAEPEQKTKDAEVVKEPLDPESLKQIQTLYAEGLQHHKENHLGLALEYYEKALALPGGQSFASLHVNLGSVLMAQNKFSEALDSFEQAKRIQPNNVKAIYNYSVALLHLDRPQEAQRLLRRILELDSTHQKATITLSHLNSPIL